MNKIKPIILICLALVISLFITLWIMNKFVIKDTIITPPTVTRPIAVATIDLPWGTFIEEKHYKMVPFLEKSLPAGSFFDSNSSQKLVGRTILYPIKADEPILESRLAPVTTKDGGVAVLIGVGKRAMAVKVDKVVGVAGFIYPRHRVDILVSLREKDQKKRTGPVTKTVLENIQVLAVGTEMAVETEQGPNGRREKSVSVDVITLEVSPEDAEKLALAATEGKIQLALRNSNNTDPIGTKGITIPDLLNSCLNSNTPDVIAVTNTDDGKKKTQTRTIKIVKPPKKDVDVILPPPPPPKPSPFIVELVKGDKMSEVKFDKGI